VRNDPRSDADLLSVAARGDGAAFGVLVRRYIRPATLLAAQLLGDRDDAEDIVQHAFTVVHQRAASFQQDRPFGPWLFAIVRRLAANRRAREQRRSRLLRSWSKGTVAEQEVVRTENTLLARVDAEAAHQALAELSPMQRACFELVTVRDLPPEEVAAMHAIAESTVRQLVFRARRAIGRALEGSHRDHTDD
jgi:RNA polymerase sigma-70 factor (ECF subfamily)